MGDRVQLGPLGITATNRPIVPVAGDYDDGEIGRMIGRGNESTRRKRAPVPLCPPQTLNDARTRTRAASMGSQRLTVWAMERPWNWVIFMVIMSTLLIFPRPHKITNGAYL
jgi:hypothetical protein